MTLITIDSENCTQCNACIDVCPAMVLSEKDGMPYSIQEREASCIDCFHCEAVCPTEALHHNHRAQAAVSSSPSTLSPEALTAYLQSRRSIRRYKEEKVSREVMEKVLEAVRYAPTGINRQRNHWVIVSDSELIRKIAQATVDWMRTLENIAPEMYNYFSSLIQDWDKGINRISRSAPQLAFCCGPQDPLGKTDADIATSHMEMVFPSFGIGSCWAGYIITAFSNNQQLKKLIGLGDDMNAYGILMFGYPQYQYESIPERKPATVDWL